MVPVLGESHYSRTPMALTHVGSFTTAISNLFHEFLRKNPIVAYIIVFWRISGDFLFIQIRYVVRTH